MRALGFEPKKEEIKKMIGDIDKDGKLNESLPPFHYLHPLTLVIVIHSLTAIID
jgi:hypothetical protein